MAYYITERKGDLPAAALPLRECVPFEQSDSGPCRNGAGEQREGEDRKAGNQPIAGAQMHSPIRHPACTPRLLVLFFLLLPAAN